MSLKPTTQCQHSGAEAVASGAANACPICLSQKLSALQARADQLQEQIKLARTVLMKAQDKAFNLPRLSVLYENRSEIYKQAIEETLETFK